MQAIISIIAENKPGILFRVTHVFRARNFNIDSISVGEMAADHTRSKITIVMKKENSEQRVEQIIKQLTKMIDVISVVQLDKNQSVCRELCLFRIKVKSATHSMEIHKLADAYGGRIHDARKDSVMVELTATPDHTKAFEELVSYFGILDVARTGVSALARRGSTAVDAADADDDV